MPVRSGFVAVIGWMAFEPSSKKSGRPSLTGHCLTASSGAEM